MYDGPVTFSLHLNGSYISIPTAVRAGFDGAIDEAKLASDLRPYMYAYSALTLYYLLVPPGAGKSHGRF